MKPALPHQIANRSDRAVPVSPSDALAVLEQAAAKSANENSVPKLLEILAEHAAQLCRSPLTVVALYVRDGNQLRVMATNSVNVPTANEFASLEELNEWCLQHASGPDTPAHQNLPQSPEDGSLGSLYRPLVVQGQTLGVLWAFASQSYDHQSGQWLALLMSQVASVLYALRLQEQVQAQCELIDHAARVQTTLQQVSTLYAKANPQGIAAADVLSLLRSIIPFDSGALYKRERSTRFLMLTANRAGQTVPVPDDKKVMRFQTLPLLHEILMVHTTIFLDDVKQARRWRPHLPEHTTGSWAGLPLIYDDEIVGLLCLGSDERDFFRPLYRQTLDLFKGVFAILMQIDILEKRKGHERAQFSNLSRQVIIAQEEERKHVSRELHDEAGQSLTALTINLELLQQDLNGQSQALIERAREAVRMTHQTLQGIRSVASRLRPPSLEMLGLVGALEQLCSDIRRRTGLETVLHAEPIDGLSDQVSLTLYRFVQESLTNVNKHAKATRAEIHIVRTKQEIVVTIQDNGVGFDQEEHLQGPRKAGRLGLLGMKERLALVNGQLTIESSPGQGTLVIAEIPLKKVSP